MQLRALFPVLGQNLRNRSRNFGRVAAIGLLVSGGFWASSGIRAQSGAQSATVKVTATNLRNSKGVVRACMTTNPELFPKCRGEAKAHSVVVPAGSTVTFSFKNVAPGRYAIALLHDENNNGKADRALMMMPKEGYGFSRDAKVRMGPPKFSAAAFDVTAEDQSQTIRMRYML
ncbi:DUF2141 domain-containing protein [Pontixanthobacter aquaemixtae]|uniref:DUF2141 domain-containing protein n=1 Tax=Pontixanthobacter aquaemixtae TaxID=1958940 RepID=A0A844ZT48_9SPHN|nr:DUF2141 domain-containing protein [Pontixanthobacter aquaemixtae]MXO91491.1 DUF2141 domain-containing protein [Pontixanthobacter aquaemixtae]